MVRVRMWVGAGVGVVCYGQSHLIGASVCV